MSRTAVVGVGAIGGVLAGLLHVAGSHQVILCTRRPLPALQVETPEAAVQVRARNLTDPQQGEPVDWVLIATKTYDAAGAAAWLPRLCGPATMVAIVQNGVEHRENFAAWLAPQQMLPVVIDVPAERRPDGSVLQRGDAFMRVERTAAGASFAELFAGTRATIEQTPDFLSALWHKLCINSAGVLSALTLKPAGVLRDEALGEVALKLIEECAAVGRAEGAHLPQEIAATILANYRAGSPDSINSLLADRLAHRQTEIEARNGVIVRRGAKHGIPTPANHMALALFNAMSD